MEVGAATTSPVAFQGAEYVRVASYKKKLRAHAELERRLWRCFEREVFDTSSAMDRLSDEEVLDLLDYPGYFRLVGTPLPENRAGILDHLQQSDLITRSSVGWTVTDLGAALVARDLLRFPTLERKTVRVVQYQGSGRVETIREREFKAGYAMACADQLRVSHDERAAEDFGQSDVRDVVRGEVVAKTLDPVGEGIRWVPDNVVELLVREARVRGTLGTDLPADQQAASAGA